MREGKKKATHPPNAGQMARTRPCKGRSQGLRPQATLTVGHVADFDTVQVDAHELVDVDRSVEAAQWIGDRGRAVQAFEAGVPLQRQAEGLLRGDDHGIAKLEHVVRGGRSVGQVERASGLAVTCDTTARGEEVRPQDLLLRVLVADVDPGVVHEEVIELFGTCLAFGIDELVEVDLEAQAVSSELLEVRELPCFLEGAEVVVSETVRREEELRFRAQLLACTVQGRIVVDHPERLSGPKALDLVGGNEACRLIIRSDRDVGLMGLVHDDHLFAGDVKTSGY